MKLSTNVLVVVLVLVLLLGGGGHFYGGPYHGGFEGVSGFLILVLIILALTGQL